MPAQNDHFEVFSIFDDQGEVKRLVEQLIRERDHDVMIECLRRLDFSYIFTLTKREKTTEVEFTRPEIDGSWDWRNGNIDELLQKRIEQAIADL
jgi:hypothetical protein